MCKISCDLRKDLECSHSTCQDFVFTGDDDGQPKQHILLLGVLVWIGVDYSHCV